MLSVYSAALNTRSQGLIAYLSYLRSTPNIPRQGTPSRPLVSFESNSTNEITQIAAKYSQQKISSFENFLCTELDLNSEQEVKDLWHIWSILEVIHAITWGVPFREQTGPLSGGDPRTPHVSGLDPSRERTGLLTRGDSWLA